MEATSQSQSDPGIYRSVGIFWNLDTCPIPAGKSAKEVVAHLRKFFVEYRSCHKERDFFFIGDVKKQPDQVCVDISRSENVLLIHTPTGSTRNRTDKMLRDQIKKFIDKHGEVSGSNSAVIILVSGGAVIIPVLRSYILERGCSSVLLHPAASSKKLTIGWTERYPLEEFFAAVGSRDTSSEWNEVNNSVQNDFPRMDSRAAEKYSVKRDWNTNPEEVYRDNRDARNEDINFGYGVDYQSKSKTKSKEKRSSDLNKKPEQKNGAQSGQPEPEPIYINQTHLYICVHPDCFAGKYSGVFKTFTTYNQCVKHISAAHGDVSTVRPEWRTTTLAKKYFQNQQKPKQRAKRFCCAYPTCNEDRGGYYSGCNMCQFFSEEEFMQHFRRFHHYVRCDPAQFLFIKSNCHAH